MREARHAGSMGWVFRLEAWGGGAKGGEDGENQVRTQHENKNGNKKMYHTGEPMPCRTKCFWQLLAKLN